MVLNNPANLQKQIQHLKFKTCPAKVQITVSRVKRHRTSGKPGEKSNMNGYYWLYLTVIADETGNDPMDLHAYFKSRLLPPRIVTLFDNEVRLPASTAVLSGMEMMDYMQKIELLTGVPIPEHPDEHIN